MPPPRALRPGEAKRTLAHRLGTRLAPRLLQLATRFGIRPYRCYLLWTRWTGRERGEGKEEEIARVELLPTPKVDVSGISYEGTSVGRVPTGSITLREITVNYTADQLQGYVIPDKSEDVIPEPFDFHYEIVEDDRGDSKPKRSKYRISRQPFRDAENVMWVVGLERVSEDNGRDGKSDFDE